jgi:hypothetical protein
MVGVYNNTSHQMKNERCLVVVIFKLKKTNKAKLKGHNLRYLLNPNCIMAPK